MLHTKFRGNQPTGSGDEDSSLKGFDHTLAWSCDQNVACKLSMALPKEVLYKIST